MPSATRRVKDMGKRGLRTLLEVGQRFGIDITPHHFYSDVPDFRELRTTTRWRRPYSMYGVRGADIEGQFAFARECCDPCRDRLARRDVHSAAIARNGEAGYGRGEAAFLHAFVRRHRPPKVVQVGCGVSTAVILQAAGEAGYQPELVCVEPYPNEFLRRAAGDGQIVLVPQKAQDVDLEVLAGVGPGGLLFVDSTHTLKPGSEVNRIILEVLPRLPSGSWVHFHDIYFPHDFMPDILGAQLFFFRESVLLHGCLVGNPRLSIAASLSMLHHADAEALREILVDYDPCRCESGVIAEEGDFASSIYLRVD